MVQAPRQPYLARGQAERTEVRMRENGALPFDATPRSAGLVARRHRRVATPALYSSDVLLKTILPRTADGSLFARLICACVPSNAQLPALLLCDNRIAVERPAMQRERLTGFRECVGQPNER